MTEKKMQYIITGNSITLFMDGKSYSTTKDNTEWDKIVRLLTEVDPESIDKEALIELMSPKNRLLKYFDSKKIPIFIENGLLKYKDYVVKTSLVDRIQHVVERAGEVQPFLRFIENLFTNPSMQSVNELYLFLEHNSLPITDDGNFLAYKKVKVVEEGKKFMDIYTGKIDNSPGAVVCMHREEVNDDRTQACSTGLHVCSKNYLQFFGSDDPTESTAVVVKVNPRDVVSVPDDYDNAKMRVCRYTVVKELPEYREKKLPDYYADDDFEEEDEMVDVSEEEHDDFGESFDSQEFLDLEDLEYEFEGEFFRGSYVHAGHEYEGFILGHVLPGEKPKDVLDILKEKNLLAQWVFENFNVKTKIKNTTKEYPRYLMLVLYKDGNDCLRINVPSKEAVD